MEELCRRLTPTAQGCRAQGGFGQLNLRSGGITAKAVVSRPGLEPGTT
jgi:hypothetical protein